MAQKAAKTLRHNNTTALTRLHTTSLTLHIFFLLFRFLHLLPLFSRSSSRPLSLTLYIILCLPSFLIEAAFEILSRPTATKAGEDLDAKGLMEVGWDVVYWTWGCLGVVALLGDRGWWVWGGVPVYGGWVAWRAYSGVMGGAGMGGLMGGAGQGMGEQGGESKRQRKLEKRGGGGQKVVYR